MKSPEFPRSFLFAIFLFSTSFLSAKAQVHEINGVASLTLDEAWKFQPVNPMMALNPNRIIYGGVFYLEGDHPIPVIVTCIIGDLPRDVILTTKLEDIAKANAKTQTNSAKKRMPKDVETEIGELVMKKVKLVNPDRSVYTQTIGEKGKKPFILSGVVWKSDSRTFCLQTVLMGPDPLNLFWLKFLENWKDLTEEDRLYAESYENRQKFLTAEQKKKLPEVLKGEAATDLELKFTAMALAKKEDPEKRAEYRRMLREANARKMRLIYLGILSKDQKTKFEQSIKRRLNPSDSKLVLPKTSKALQAYLIGTQWDLGRGETATFERHGILKTSKSKASYTITGKRTLTVTWGKKHQIRCEMNEDFTQIKELNGWRKNVWKIKAPQ